MRRLIKAKIKHYILKFFTLTIMVIFIFANFPLELLVDYATIKMKEAKIVDKQYLALQDNNVIDNFKLGARYAYANPGTRAKTVEYFMYQLDGIAAGQSDDTTYTGVAQTINLSESSVSVKSAFLEFTLQGAYTTLAYMDGFTLSFGRTAGACPQTITYTARASASGLTAPGGAAEHHVYNLRADVTPDFSTYTGSTDQCVNLQYNFSFDGGAADATAEAGQIQSPQAKLVVTYTYDDTSATQLNTIYYPLEYTTNQGTKATQTAAGASADFTYYTTAPELTVAANLKSQFFHVNNEMVSTATADSTTVFCRFNGSTCGSNTATHYFDNAQRSGGGFQFFVDALPSFAYNDVGMKLRMTNSGRPQNIQGGMNIMTYTYLNSAATKTKTVRYSVGEVIAAAGSAAKSALVGPTVVLREGGISVQKAWFRIETSTAAADTLATTTKVGGNAETSLDANDQYAIAAPTAWAQQVNYINHVVPSSDYAAIDSGVNNGVTMQMTADWATGGGSVSAELFITYTYTNESTGWTSTRVNFAGQQTTNGATTFSTATGALDTAIPDTGGTLAVQSQYIHMQNYSVNSTANEARGINLTTSTCTATSTSTAETTAVANNFALYKSTGTVVTTSDTATYTACYSSAQASLFNGALVYTVSISIAAAGTLTIGVTSGSKLVNVDSGAASQFVHNTACSAETTCAAFKMTAGGVAVSVTSITITETNASLNADTDLSNAALIYDTDANYSNGTGGTFGTDTTFTSQAVTFTNVGLSVPNGSTYYFYIRVDFSNGTAQPDGGLTINFQIGAAGDVVSDGTESCSPSCPLGLAGITTIRPNVSSYSNSTEGILADGARTGQTISISGAGFGTSCSIAGGNKVTIDTYDVSCTGATFTDTSITIAVDSGVNVYGGTGANGLLVTIGNTADDTRQTFYVYPDITSTAPSGSTGVKEGDSITITGNKFRATQGTGTVQFINCATGAVTASVGTWSDTSITATVPAGIDDNDDLCDVQVTRDVDSKTDTQTSFTLLPNIITLSVCATCNADSSRTYNSGDTDGIVQLNGSHFGTSQGANGKVEFTGGLGTATPGATIHSSGSLGACGTLGWAANGSNVCIEVTSAAIVSTAYTGAITLTRNDLKTSNAFGTFRVLPRIDSNTSTADIVGNVVQIDGNHFCQSGTCPVSPPTAGDTVQFGATAAISTDFVTSPNCTGASKWSHIQICVKVPSSTPTGSQPTKVTSNTSYLSDTKDFTVQSTQPNPSTVSEPPSRQYKSNDTTIIPGPPTPGTTNESSVYLKADLSASLTISMALQVEVKPVGIAFACGAGNCADAIEGTVIGGGACNNCTSLTGAKVLVTGLSDTGKHWQARTRNTSTNEYSAWVAYGGNLETETDFQVDTTAPTIGYGGSNTCDDADGDPTTNTATITFGLGEIVDSGEIQYSTSSTFASGNQTQTNITDNSSYSFSLLNLDSNTIYYWRVKATDFAGNNACRSNGASGTTCPASSPYCSFTTLSVSKPAKTTQFHITDQTAALTNPSVGTYYFTVAAPETSVNMKSAFVEVTGLVSGGTNPITIQVNGVASKAYAVNATNPTHFKFMYEITSPDSEANLNINDGSPCTNGAGGFPPCNKLTVTPGAGMTVNITSAKIIASYAYTP